MGNEPVRHLGKYELQERLGHGGMAQVWKAYDRQLQRYVAIKLLHPNLQADPSFGSRFQREAQAIESLRHPNIVQIHDFQVSQPPESEAPTPFMVMAYIEGQTLADYLATTSAKGNIPSPSEIVNLFTSISLAVDYAHQKGMIHRDIKPANILLDRNNRARNPMGEPILTDFGLARLLGVSAGTLTASLLRTSLYTSPELARGYDGNERSDIYSLGVMLYEMVTGAPPFRGESPMAVLEQHLGATPPVAALLNPHIPPALALVIMTALAKDPNARFASATAMATALAQSLDVPFHENLNQPVYPTDTGHTPAVFGPSAPHLGAEAATPPPPSSATASPAMPPASGAVPAILAGGSNPDRVSPGHLPPQPTAASPWQPFSVKASGGGLPGTSPQGKRSSPSGAVHASLDPAIMPPPPPPPARGRWRALHTALIALLALALLGSGLGAYLAFSHQSSPPAAIPGGQAFFLSSGQFNRGTAQGIADQLQINLQHIPNPHPGKSYYAWLLADRQLHTETQPLEPPPQFSLPLLLGKLTVVNGTGSFFYKGSPQHDNLISIASRMLITEEDSGSKPLGPAASRSAWRYYAEIPQALYRTPPLSALDHIRHLFYKETRVDVLGLPGGLDVWLFRNTEKVLEWSISARDDYHAQVSDPTIIHNLFLSILDYLDGSPNVHIDVPEGSPIAADRVASRVALLSVVPAQINLTNLANNPPGYVQHIVLHLNGVVQSPGATQQMRLLSTQIIEALNNVKMWLGQVRSYARQLVKMNAVQLAQPSTLTMLDSMLLYATYAYIGQLDPRTNKVLPGVLQVHYDVAKLATFTLTPNLPQHL